MDKSFTVMELADTLGKSRETIRRWLRSGELTCTVKSKRKTLVSYDDLLDFVGRHPEAISTSALRRIGLSNRKWDEMDAMEFLNVKCAPGKLSTEDLVNMLNERYNEDVERLKEISSKTVKLQKSRVAIEGDMQIIEEFRKKLASDTEGV